MNTNSYPRLQNQEPRVNQAEIKWVAPEDEELNEDLLDGISGGINPQPLPPRGDDFRKNSRSSSYIGETEKY